MRIFLILLTLLLISCKNENKLQNKTEISKTKIESSDSIVKKTILLPLEQKWNDSIFKLPYQLKKDEISVVIGIGYGWLVYDELHHFVYSNDTLSKHFIEKIPKAYIKKNKEKYHLEKIGENSELKNNSKYYILNTPEVKRFLKYEQDDFTFNSKKVNNCIVTDNNSYSIYFIQNNKFKSYWYYAPNFMLERCNNENINKKMLQEFIGLLKNWNVDL